MARSRKNKIFDLFKSDFKITFFYKPTMKDGDEFYYLVLDEVIKLKIKEIRGVIVIDDVIPLTNTYIKPIYEKLVRVLMSQSHLTVLISLIGNTINIQQACIACNCPVVDDERYLTVANDYYQKLRAFYNDDASKFGFYILAVGDDEELPPKDTKTVIVRETPPKPKAKKPKPETPTISGVSPMVEQIANSLQKSLQMEFENVQIEPLTQDSLTVMVTPKVKFSVELADGGIYIKDLLQEPGGSPLNLIKLMNLVNAFQKLQVIDSNVYILSVQNAELSSLCLAKGFISIQEEQKLPMNRLFRQAFHGYGSYQVTS